MSNNIVSGSTIKVTDPRTKATATGTVDWVSPTHKTYRVVLADGFKTFEFAKEA